MLCVLTCLFHLALRFHDVCVMSYAINLLTVTLCSHTCCLAGLHVLLLMYFRVIIIMTIIRRRRRNNNNNNNNNTNNDNSNSNSNNNDNNICTAGAPTISQILLVRRR